MQKKFPDMNQSEREWALQQVNRRWGQLYGLEKEWSENVIKYLSQSSGVIF